MSRIDTNRIEVLSSSLKEILNAELTLGNNVIETSIGWLKIKSLIIFLEKPFHEIYNIPNIEFTELSDPHYWKSQYCDCQNEQILACRF